MRRDSTAEYGEQVSLAEGASVSWTLIVDPPKLLRWMSATEVDRHTALLDLEPDVLEAGDLLLDINVVFSPIAVRRGVVHRVDYYVGCTGARVELEASNGQAKALTGDATIQVDYSNTIQRTQSSGGTLRPSVAIESADAKAAADAGEVRYHRGQETTLQASYKSTERTLAVVNLGPRVRWELRLPRGQRVVSDFIEGNLLLRGLCTWKAPPRSGTLSVRPSEVTVFREDRRPIEPRKALAMLYVLWRAGVLSPSARDGAKVNFRVEQGS